MPNPLNLPGRVANYWSAFSRLEPQAKRQYGVSKWRMMREHMALRRLNELGWHEYIYYRLFDPSVPWEKKKEYIGNKLMRRLWSALNPLEYRYVFKNKLVFKQVCLSSGIAVAPLLGTFDPDYGYTSDGSPLRTVGDLEKWIRGLQDPNVVIKPAEGAEGRMVHVFHGKEEGDVPALLALDGTRWRAQTLYDFMMDKEALEFACSGGTEVRPTFVIERRLRPHAELEDLSPHTLCTFRIVTLLDRGIEPQLLAAVFKLQSNASGVDNMHQQSIGVDVNQETGELGTGWVMLLDYYDARFDELPQVERLTADPATGVEFSHRKVPMWDQVLDLVLKAARRFSYVRAVGWDVAVTPDGPCIVEGNWAWGEELAQGGIDRGIYQGSFKTICDRLRREGKADRALV